MGPPSLGGIGEGNKGGLGRAEGVAFVSVDREEFAASHTGIFMLRLRQLCLQNGAKFGGSFQLKW